MPDEGGFDIGAVVFVILVGAEVARALWLRWFHGQEQLRGLTNHGTGHRG